MTIDNPVEICDICGCMYVPSELGDKEFHTKIHDDVVNGIRINITVKDQIIIKEQDTCLLLIDSKSTNSQVDRLQKLSRYVSLSVSRDALFSYHFNPSYPLDSKYKFFLLCFKNRAIGYLDIQYVSKGLNEPIWLIKMIWLAVSHRRKKLAKFMIESSLNHLGESLSSVGWEAPFSEMGLKFVKSLCPNGYRVFQTRYG
ncbi:MAG TPA: hypothetical protein DIW23_12100 [Anaerolineae bacterium]|nr:hypothetical protein [Anaerolineae bacterium]HCR72180.1 hypothetical protein [Anaerolineae bacterium]